MESTDSIMPGQPLPSSRNEPPVVIGGIPDISSSRSIPADIGFTSAIPSENSVLAPLSSRLAGATPLNEDIVSITSSTQWISLETTRNLDAVSSAMDNASGSVPSNASFAPAPTSPTGVQETATNPQPTSTPKSSGLGTGAKAGIAVGIVLIVLLLSGGLFLWWRRRKQKAQGRGGGEDAHIPELDGKKGPEMLDSRMLPAELAGQTGPPPAELSGKGGFGVEDGLKKDSMIAAAELPASDIAPASPDHQPPSQTRYEMDSTQQPKNPPPPPIVRKQIPEPELDTTSTVSATSPDTQVSSLPPTLTETVSPMAHGGGETQEMLMEQYTQLEARRQRVLELKRIEEEQAELQAKLKRMAEK